MAGETIITVVGNLVDDPELRFTPSGAAVSNFRIASTPRTFDKQSNEWRDGEAMFLTCSVWRQAAENVAESLQRGMRVVVQGRLKERLLRAYFTEGANVANHPTLQALAAEAGLPADAAGDVLADGNAYRAEVLADLEGAMDRELTGVPGFVIEDRLLIPGAQEVDTFVAVLTRAKERFASATAPRWPRR